jgi:enoyl-CoA hydratase
MFYTGENATAAELHSYGSVVEVVPRSELRAAARRWAERIAAKHPTVIRRAKESVNGIEAVDPRHSYRFEQGFTFELNLSDVPDEARRAFVEKRKPNFEERGG